MSLRYVTSIHRKEQPQIHPSMARGLPELEEESVSMPNFRVEFCLSSVQILHSVQEHGITWPILRNYIIAVCLKLYSGIF